MQGFGLKGQVFPKEYLVFWHVQKHEIYDFFMIFMKFSIFRGNRRKTFLLFVQNSCFRTGASHCRECCLNQWNTIHFGWSWAPWALFLRKSVFLLNFLEKVEKWKIMELFSFEWKREIPWISWYCKNTNNSQGISRFRDVQNHKNQEFPWISLNLCFSWNFMNFHKFHEFYEIS